MPNLVRAFFSIFLTIIVFVLYPNMRAADLSDRLAERIAKDAAITFVDSVRGKGYVDVRDYETFQRQVDASGNAFNVTIEHKKKEIQPVYSNPNDPTTFQNTFTVSYEGFYTSNILASLYPSGSVLPKDDVSRRYKMHEGDLFSVRLEPKEVPFGEKLRYLIFHLNPAPMIIPYGGMIRNEAP